MSTQNFDKSDYKGAPPPYVPETGSAQPAPVGGGSETRTVIIDNEPQGMARYTTQPYGAYGFQRPDPVTVGITTTGQPGQQPGPAGQQPQTVIVTTQGLRLGPDPASITCPTCRQEVITVVQYENGLMTWILVGSCAAVGCWLGCCLIPLCVDDCKDVIHTCPNCRGFLGRYRRCN